MAVLLGAELLDELVSGAWIAAWPQVRADLALSYVEIGILLSAPAIVASLVEPAFGFLGDAGRRRALVRGGGVAFAASLALLARVRGTAYVRASALAALGVFPAFLLVPSPAAKLALVGVLGAIAERFGLGVAIWLPIVAPVALLVGMPREARREEAAAAEAA